MQQKREAMAAQNSDGRPDSYLNNLQVIAEIAYDIQESLKDIMRDLDADKSKLGWINKKEQA